MTTRPNTQTRTFTFEVEGRAAAGDGIPVVVSTDAVVEVSDGPEILVHTPDAIDLQRAPLPIIATHQGGQVNVGIVDELRVVGGQLRGIARFGTRPEAAGYRDDVLNRIIRSVSAGYVRLKATLRNDGVLVTTRWMPSHAALVAEPADVGAGFFRELAAQPFDLEVEREIPVDEPVVPAPATEASGERAETDSGAAAIQPIDGLTEEMQATESPAAEEQRSQPLPAEPANPETTLQRSIDMNVVQQILKMGETYGHLGGVEAARAYLATNGEPNVADFQANLLERARTPAAPTSADVGLTGNEVRKFSFLRLLRALANPQEREFQTEAAFEFEACAAARKASGTRSGKGFSIPAEVLRTPLVENQQRDITKASGGTALVSTDLLASSFIELLRKAMVTQRLGARVLTGLVGDIAIPRQSGAATAYWVAESGAPTESAQATDQVALSPKTVGAYTDFSRKLMLQSSIDVEAMVRADLAAVIGLEIDRAALYGSGAGNQPTGLKLATGVNTVDFAAAVPTFAEVVAMETEVATDNADIGTLAYLVAAGGRGALKTAAKDAGSGQFIWEPGNTVNGYRAEVSNQVVAGDYWYGNWADLLIGYWSGLDILVDPYSGSTSGTVRVVALQDVDVAARHGESFCRGAGTL